MKKNNDDEYVLIDDAEENGAAANAHKDDEYKVGEYIIYRKHGISEVLGYNVFRYGDYECRYLEIYVIKEKMRLKLSDREIDSGLIRKLCTKEEIDEALSTLGTGVRKVKGMWSRRAREYEDKLASGDIMLAADVLRDLTRDVADEDRSYSERSIYESAVFRLASEYAAIYGISMEEATSRVIDMSKQKIRFTDISDMKAENENVSGIKDTKEEK